MTLSNVSFFHSTMAVPPINKNDSPGQILHTTLPTHTTFSLFLWKKCKLRWRARLSKHSVWWWRWQWCFFAAHAWRRQWHAPSRSWAHALRRSRRQHHRRAYAVARWGRRSLAFVGTSRIQISRSTSALQMLEKFYPPVELLYQHVDH